MLDSDAAKKICQYELLQDLVSALSCSLNELAVLPELKFQLKLMKNGKALKKLGSKKAVAQAKQLVSTAQEVQIALDSANPALKQLNRPNIDVGEAALFAALISDTESRLISGDKRAFVSLSEIDGEPVDSIWARILCFEEAMHCILLRCQFQTISQKVRAKPEVDMAISIAFGRAQANAEVDVLSALRSYIHSLVADTQSKYHTVVP